MRLAETGVPRKPADFITPIWIAHTADDDEFMRGPARRRWRAGALLAAFALLIARAARGFAETAAPSVDIIWTVPEIGALPDDQQGRLIRRGHDLVTATHAHIDGFSETQHKYGPFAPIRAALARLKRDDKPSR
jgi:hypothetical protein